MGEGDDLGGACALHTIKLDAKGLWLIAGIHYLDDDLAGGLIEDAASEESVLALLTGYGLTLHGEREHVGTLVRGVELLHIVRYRLEHAEVIEPDGIGTPLPTLDVGEEGCIGGHVDDVGIALDTGHVSGL